MDFPLVAIFGLEALRVGEEFTVSGVVACATTPHEERLRCSAKADFAPDNSSGLESNKIAEYAGEIDVEDHVRATQRSVRPAWLELMTVYPVKTRYEVGESGERLWKVRCSHADGIDWVSD